VEGSYLGNGDPMERWKGVTWETVIPCPVEGSYLGNGDPMARRKGVT
jgi:hypothetical protein